MNAFDKQLKEAIEKKYPNAKNVQAKVITGQGVEFCAAHSNPESCYVILVNVSMSSGEHEVALVTDTFESPPVPYWTKLVSRKIDLLDDSAKAKEADAAKLKALESGNEHFKQLLKEQYFNSRSFYGAHFFTLQKGKEPVNMVRVSFGQRRHCIEVNGWPTPGTIKFYEEAKRLFSEIDRLEAEADKEEAIQEEARQKAIAEYQTLMDAKLNNISAPTV